MKTSLRKHKKMNKIIIMMKLIKFKMYKEWLIRYMDIN